ncbi:MAG: hypothetical protein ABSH26_14925 [Opitutaceae bacterium]
MKTSRSLLLLAAAMSPAALLICGCSKSDNASANAEKVKNDAKEIAADVKAAASDTWDSIKGFTYDRRSDFSVSIDRMSAQLDEKTREFRTKVAGASDAASKDRESAIKEYDEARADLKSRLSELGNATADTWADAKEKVAQAWKRVQGAYDKLKANAGS